MVSEGSFCSGYRRHIRPQDGDRNGAGGVGEVVHAGENPTVSGAGIRGCVANSTRRLKHTLGARQIMVMPSGSGILLHTVLPPALDLVDLGVSSQSVK